MSNLKSTLLIGASDNPSRYSFIAINKLRQHGHSVVAIGKKETTVADIKVSTSFPKLKNIQTVTIYLNALNQKSYYNYIISLKPQRVIFNPGAENKEFAELLAFNEIHSIEACTLVLLATHQY